MSEPGIKFRSKWLNWSWTEIIYMNAKIMKQINMKIKNPGNFNSGKWGIFDSDLLIHW